MPSATRLILRQRGATPVTPALLRDRLATLETTLDAFDGAFVRLPATSDAIMKNAALNAAALAADLAPLGALQTSHLRYNLALVTAQHDLDPFDDWSVVLRNFSALARAARAAGLVGIVIDNEDPAGLRVNYPEDAKFRARSLAEYRAQMQSVGKQIMQALAAEFPGIVVVVLRGPAAAEDKTPPALVNRAFDSAELLGPFFAGFIEGKGAGARVVDGGADYGLRIDDQFQASYAWRRNGIASDATASPFIGSALRPIWPASIDVAFGVAESDGAQANRLPNLTPVWENSVASALRRADTLVWAGFDQTDLTQAPATSPWVVAARRAKAAGTTGAKLGSAAAASGSGLIAQYFESPDQTRLARTLIDGVVDNVWTETNGPTALTQQTNFSVVWSGYLEAPVSGTYLITATTDDGMRVTLGGAVLVDEMHDQGPTPYTDGIVMQAGLRYPIKIEYFQHGGPAAASISWEPPGMAKELLPTSRMYPVN